MGKEKRKKDKQKKPDVKKKAPKQLIKALPVLLVLGAVALAGVLLYRGLFLSDYFKIDFAKLIWYDEFGAVSREKGRYNRIRLTGKGENIFKFDIKSAALAISEDHPEFENCTLRRMFPNELVVDIYARQPVAQISYDRFYLIDKDAFLLTEPTDSRIERLPIITGAMWWTAKKVGQQLSGSKLSRALLLIGTIKDSGLLDGHSLSRVDVSDGRNLLFYIDGDLEVKIGHERFDERLALLREALSSSYVDKNDLEYIDLRFDDIVFGTR